MSERGVIRVSLLASGINNNHFSQENDIGNNIGISNKFIKPRLVSSRKPEKNQKSKVNNSLAHAQSDLRGVLANESNEDMINEGQENQDLLNKEKDYYIPEEEVSSNQLSKDKVDPFKEAEMLNSNLSNQQDNDKLSEGNSSGASLISRLSTVKNKAINVGSKAFSMVSEVANKSFDIKNENSKEDAKSALGNTNKENSSERIEPTFLNNTEKVALIIQIMMILLKED